MERAEGIERDVRVGGCESAINQMRLLKARLTVIVWRVNQSGFFLSALLCLPACLRADIASQMGAICGIKQRQGRSSQSADGVSHLKQDDKELQQSKESLPPL